MDLTTFSNILISTFFVGLLILIVFGFYRNYRTAKYRSDLFTIRNALFDDAADGKIAFEHPAYVMLRTLLNGHLRFAHRLTLWEPALLFVIDKLRGSIPPEGITFDVGFEHAMRDLEPDVVDQLKQYRSQLENRTLSFLFFSPAEFLILVFPIILLSSIAALFRGNILKTVTIAETSVETRVTDSAYALGLQSDPFPLAA